MKKINAHKAHQRLWYWLMRNSYMSKDKWPEWNINGGKIPYAYVHDQCFACMMVKEDCTKCPLEWPNGKTCDGGNASLYRLWINAPDSLVRKEYAQQIADLPWHGKQMFTFNKGEYKNTLNRSEGKPEMAEKDKWSAHQKKKGKCESRDQSFSSDNVTCLHPDNPTAMGVRVCGYEHCPIK